MYTYYTEIHVCGFNYLSFIFLIQIYNDSKPTIHVLHTCIHVHAHGCQAVIL